MGAIQHHISHLKPKRWFHSVAFLSVLVPGLTRVLALTSLCRYFCSSRAVRGVPRRRHMYRVTFSSANRTGTDRAPPPGRRLFLHTVPVSENWSCSDPAHVTAPVRNNQKLHLYSPTASDYTHHQLSSSVCDFRLRAVFHIDVNVALHESTF